MPAVLAIFAHPDDIEFVAAGTMLQLQRRGWELHYLNLCNGNCGSTEMDRETTAATRLEEAKRASGILGAEFYPPICNDLELVYSVPLLRQVAAVVRQARPRIVLTHSPSDYMEDHMNAQRLAVTATFCHGIPNFQSDPPREAFFDDVTVYHAMPHSLRSPLREKVQAGAFVDTASVHSTKREALAAHESQKRWLDVSQGMDSYLIAMDDMAAAVGEQSGRFESAEGWRRHLHIGFSGSDSDPLVEALGDDCWVNPSYETGLG